jgi:para-nitrobenzyl esterase
VNGLVVETAPGKVRGTTVTAPGGSTVQRFLGLPYAAPPVGDLRWRAPVAPRPWPGVRDADAFGDAAPQGPAIEERLPAFVVDRASEDCLTLNIWTPATDGARPVMVWIPGGAYATGGSSQPVYDGARVAAEQDVVIVTINYRLGALGFLLLDGDADGNCGLRDQLAALAWVREHASVFGGDPARVTVFGESAGAGSILHLLGSSRRGHAFDRAIVQSAEPRTLARDQAAAVAQAVADALGIVAPDAASLRGVPVERLVAAQATAATVTLPVTGLMPFNPAIDGDVCDVAIDQAIAAGRTDDVGLIIGTTRAELDLFPDPRAADADDERLARWAERLVPGVKGLTVVDAYRAQLGAAAEPDRLWNAMRTDALMRVPNLRLAERRASRGAPTFVYRFDWEAPQLGAAHAVDVPFTFGTFDREGWGAVVGHDARAERLSDLMRAAWATFAATGYPDPDGAWPPYDVDDRPTMLFTADGARRANAPDDATRACWSVLER